MNGWLRRGDRRREREEELRRLQEDLSHAASKAKDSNRALLVILRKLCAAFEWAFGESWVPSRDGRVLKPGPAWPRANRAYTAFRVARRRLGFLPGRGLPGEVWSQRAPVWIENLGAQGHFRSRSVARATGFRSALGVPVVAGDGLAAVLVFYRLAPGPRDAALVAGLTSAVAPLGPVVALKRVEVELGVRERQQKAVARLGLLALSEKTDLLALQGDAVRLAATTLGVEHCQLAELTPDGETLLLRAGVGWAPGHVGRYELPANDGSQAGYTLRSGGPVIVPDLDRETRFRPSDLLTGHGIVSGLSVIIHGHQTPLGVLGVHDRLRRTFTPDDVHFLQAVANVLGTALERRQAEEELAAHRRHLETVVARRTSQLEASHERLRIAERLASIGTLAAGLGHDLGNMVLPVLCRLDSLEASRLTVAAREDLAAVRHAVEYLRQLSRGLRLFALDPEDANGSPDAATDLQEWWLCVSPLLRNVLPKRRVRLTCDIPRDLPPVAVPPHRLSQAVLNLVANAAEAIAGEGRVRVWAAAGGPAEVHLGVADDGKGMSPDVRRHSLDPFFTTKKRGLSTGLGLALVHAVAQACGGAVDIESREGAGTDIRLTLPVADGPVADAGQGPAARPLRRVAAVSMKDSRIAAYASLLIRSAGIAVKARPPCEPGDTQVWITEPSRRALGVARQYLKEDARRRVVFFGEMPGASREPGLVVVDRRGGPDAMRRSLRQVVFQLLEKDHDGDDSGSVRR